ncbi:acetyl-coenzyme A synthetase N-terminal domain-containing protein, partial [Actinokineospora sp. 24-640]
MTEHSGPRPALDNLSTETRVFPPPDQVAAEANVRVDAYGRAVGDRLGFWAEQAHRLQWSREWNEVLDWSDAPFAKWFVGGTLNVAVNCVDRHVEAGNGERVALFWEGEPGDARTVTYAQLQTMVCKAANGLSSLGLVAGDRVAIQMPMLVEAVVA